MVTAITAAATDTRVTISDGIRQLAVYRAKGDELEGPPKTHGVNLDGADDAVEQLGYVAGVWRWQENGAYYKAVVAPARRYAPHEQGKTPEQIRAANMKAFGNPEGRRR